MRFADINPTVLQAVAQVLDEKYPTPRPEEIDAYLKTEGGRIDLAVRVGQCRVASDIKQAIRNIQEHK